MIRGRKIKMHNIITIIYNSVQDNVVTTSLKFLVWVLQYEMSISTKPFLRRFFYEKGLYYHKNPIYTLKDAPLSGSGALNELLKL